MKCIKQMLSLRMRFTGHRGSGYLTWRTHLSRMHSVMCSEACQSPGSCLNSGISQRESNHRCTTVTHAGSCGLCCTNCVPSYKGKANSKGDQYPQRQVPQPGEYKEPLLQHGASWFPELPTPLTPEETRSCQEPASKVKRGHWEPQLAHS